MNVFNRLQHAQGCSCSMSRGVPCRRTWLVAAACITLSAGCAHQEQHASDQFKISASTHMASADMLERQNNLPGAMRQYEEVITREPSLTSAYHGLGRVQYKLGRYVEAENAISRGLGTNDEVPALHNNLGYTLMQQQKFAQAEAAFRRALELSPSFRRARINLGVVLAKQKRISESFDEFCRVVPREDAYFNIAVVRAEQDDYEGAADSLRDALELNPEYQPALDHLERVVRIARAEAAAKGAISRLAARNAVASFSEPVGSASRTRVPTCVVPVEGVSDEPATVVPSTIEVVVQAPEAPAAPVDKPAAEPSEPAVATNSDAVKAEEKNAVAAAPTTSEAEPAADGDSLVASIEIIPADACPDEFVGPPSDLAMTAESPEWMPQSQPQSIDQIVVKQKKKPTAKSHRPIASGKLSREQRDRTIRPSYSKDATGALSAADAAE